MCGIAGIYSKDLSGRYEAEIRQMAEVLTHRGPDGEGFYRDDCVVMGFKRLSIIDLENGRQPLTNEDGLIVLVCNGTKNMV
jgi:asparagine synthase (glutamine-hydrolysing)